MKKISDTKIQYSYSKGCPEKTDHERDASPLGVLRRIQRQVIIIVPTPDFCMKIDGNKDNRHMKTVNLPALGLRLGLPLLQTEMRWALCHLKRALCSPEGRQAD